MLNYVRTGTILTLRLLFRPPLTDKSGNWRYLISVFGTVFLVPGHTPRTVLRFYILNGSQNICYRGNN
jgi:hypothetical protein